MSYDVSLLDPVTKKTLDLPYEHVMTGGTFAASYDPTTGTFSPMPIREAWLNITYNYSKYYYEATEGDNRFAHEEITAYYADGTVGPTEIQYGLSGLSGKTGAESIQMLEDVIRRIEARYRKDEEWIETERKRTKYYRPDGTEIKDVIHAILNNEPYRKKEYTEMISEGPNDDYWEETAANAISPLYKLIAMAKLRPDGVWTVE